MYVLFLKLTKQKIINDYDGTFIEKLILEVRKNNHFQMYSHCLECGQKEYAEGIIELPMERYGVMNERSVNIEIFIPDWEKDMHTQLGKENQQLKADNEALKKLINQYERLAGYLEH